MMQLTTCPCKTGRCCESGSKLTSSGVAPRWKQLHSRRRCCELAEDCTRCSAHQDSRAHSGPQPTEHCFKEDLLPQWPGGVRPDEFDAVYAKISDEKAAAYYSGADGASNTEAKAEDNLRGRKAHASRRMEGNRLANFVALMKDRAAIAWYYRPPPAQMLGLGMLLSIGVWLVHKLFRPLSFLLSIGSLLVIALVVLQSAGSNALVDILSDYQFKPSYRETKNFVERTTWTVLAGWLVLVLLAHVL